MKSVVRFLFLFGCAAALHAQLPAAGTVLPLKGLPSLVYASATPAGTVALSAPVTILVPLGYTVAKDTTRATLTITAPPAPPPAPVPTEAAWITLAQSSADPLTWCVTDQPLTFTYIPSMLHVSVSLTITVAPAGVYPREEFQDIQPGPLQGSGSTSTTAPQWIKNTCGGSPGVVFASSALNAGESRTAVQARVVF